MSGGSQHNPNGRQSQLGPGWSPLQLQMANLLARAPQAHMASDRGVTWHTPTPPPHLYHVPVPSPPDPLQAMKNAGSNSVFRHTATPPELFRHTPTPPDKHLMRHTPSPGDVKTGVPLPPVDLYSHLGQARDKVVRAEDLLAYARAGVDLSVTGARANGGALSVRDAPTINSLVGRSAGRPPHARVDALLERLAPASPHSVIVHSRVAPTPSPPSSNEDSADSCGAPPGSKRKRKPERTVRVPVPPPLPAPTAPAPAPASPPRAAPPLHNGDVTPAVVDKPPSPPPQPPPPEPHARRKTRSGSAETIDNIAAMIASTDRTAEPEPEPTAPPEPEPLVTVDKLESILASPAPEPPPELPEHTEREEQPCAPAAPRTSHPDASNVPVESPSEGKPAEPPDTDAQPTASTYVDVENQLEKMFAGLDSNKPEPDSTRGPDAAHDIPATPTVAKKRRKSAPARGERRKAQRQDDAARRKGPRKKSESNRGKKIIKDVPVPTKDAYDSGSNASSSRSRGPYIQIVGPGVRTGRSEEAGRAVRGAGRCGAVRGLHGSTLGPRYDAATPDATWLCAFCQRGPHKDSLGDLFGPYPVNDDCDDYRNAESESRVSSAEWVWFHEECGVWAPGVVATGARLWGLGPAVRAAAALRCAVCARLGAHVACSARGCVRRVHVPCARDHRWTLHEQHFRATCPAHNQTL